MFRQGKISTTVPQTAETYTISVIYRSPALTIPSLCCECYAFESICAVAAYFDTFYVTHCSESRCYHAYKYTTVKLTENIIQIDFARAV